MEPSLGGSHNGGTPRSRIYRKGRASQVASGEPPLNGSGQLASAKLLLRSPGADLSTLNHRKHEARQGFGGSLGLAPRSTSAQALAGPQQRESLLLEQIAQLRLDKDQLNSHNQLLHRMMEAQSLHSVRPLVVDQFSFGGAQPVQLLTDASSLSRKRPVVGISGLGDCASGPAFRREIQAASASGASGDAFITGYEALLEQLVRLLQKLEDSPGNSQAKQGLDDCITQQRQCLLRLTEAGDAVPLLHVMEHIRMRQLQWSSHEVTHRHATALAAADLTWWQKEKLQDAAATYYQQMAFISVEGQAAATALKQALDLGQPALGRTGEQYKAVQAAQQRLHDAHLAEAGIFWALSNHFIMSDTLEPVQAARLQAALGPMLLDVAVAGRLLLAERPSRYTHLSLPMPLPEPQAETAKHQQQQQHSPGKAGQPTQQRKNEQQHGEPPQHVHERQPQAESAGMLRADLAGLQAVMRGQGRSQSAAGTEAHFGAQPGMQHVPNCAQPSASEADNRVSLLPASPRMLEQASHVQRMQQSPTAPHGKHVSPTVTNSSSSRGSFGPVEAARQSSAQVMRPGSDRLRMSPPPVLRPPSRGSTPGGRDSAPPGVVRHAAGTQELTSHRTMLMMHHQMMVSQRQPAVQPPGLPQPAKQQQEQLHMLGRQLSPRHAELPGQHAEVPNIMLPQRDAAAPHGMMQQQQPGLRRSSQQLSPAGLQLGGLQGMQAQQLGSQPSTAFTAQQILAQQLRQVPGPSMPGALGTHGRQSPELQPLSYLDPAGWPSIGAVQLSRDIGLLQEPIWPEDGDAAYRGDLSYSHLPAPFLADAPAYFQAGLMESNAPSMDDLYPMLHPQ